MGWHVYPPQSPTEPPFGRYRSAVAGQPLDREIILYCGCCPWGNCPNVKPAMALLQEMGFTHAKAMYVETGFGRDWTDKGYPVEAGTPKQ